MKSIIFFVCLLSSTLFAVPQTATLKVSGMVCGSCENAIQLTLKKKPGVTAVKANSKAGTVTVDFESGQITRKKIVETIEGLKFSVEL